MPNRFWESKTLAEMTRQEWESLCDGCGKCCLHKLEDEDSGEVYYTSVACRLLDGNSCRCNDYENRLKHVEECLHLTLEDETVFTWLPETCAYRMLFEGKSLPEWHHLITGKQDSVHRHRQSVRGIAIPEEFVHPEDFEDHIIHWVD